MKRCKQCREKFITLSRRHHYCSRECYFASLKVPVEEVYRRDRGVCHLCGKHVPFEEASRDHVRPRSMGGPTTWKNIRLAHKNCNSRRGCKPVEEFKIKTMGLTSL